MGKTIFDYINSILYSKKKFDINIEDKSFNLYMLNRWISMYSPELCYYINETSNKKIYDILPNITSQFNYLFNILPKLPYKKINYLKKSQIKKENNSKKNDNYKYVKDYADNFELSQREIEMYLDMSK